MVTLLLVYGGLFLSAFTSATLLPGSSEAVLAALVAAGNYDVRVLVLVATLGNVAGSLINWLLGIAIERYRHARWFPVSDRDYQRACHWFSRFGLWALLFAWLPVIGDPITLVAGALRVRFIPFILLVTIGKAARYAMVAGGVGWVASLFG
ncbi:YqaA family protein [Thalassospira mesophila]|uniref:Membrane protein n=1 Tax=Thalassospira mesophila TaxID=1293891 RepID=A0A1Y2L3Z9_9PROT|nr:YqaA family protein [Thalassospira mesophila]OSQ39934.1 membrane protein [Thalassospira mesophila]